MKAATLVLTGVGVFAGLVGVRMVGSYLDGRAEEEAAKRAKVHATYIAQHATKPPTPEEEAARQHQAQLASLEEADRKIAQAAACRDDIGCWGRRYAGDAVRPCEKSIERQAKWQFEWTNSLFGERQFSDPMWADKATGVIMISGQAIKMQNGFGAWRKVSYVCFYDPSTRAAQAVLQE